MLTDIEIAQQANILPIREIASKLGLTEDDYEPYGKYKAKLTEELFQKLENKQDGKLILVTAINPTPAGEGKTTTTTGLGQAMHKIGKNAVIALREPSLGPVFGVKGGAAGGGYAQVLPMEDINLHFTGDIHAITSANNLLASLIDNHIYFGNDLNIKNVTWKRCIDLNDRQLRMIETGLSGEKNIEPRKDGFNITVASEIMAILCLSNNIKELKENLGNIIIGYNEKDEPVYAKDLNAQGAMAALLKDAIKPNLVQTLEHTPAIIHGGPFANIAHGCNSIIATKLALKLGEYTVTEAGFGADLGAEKFLDIKCRKAKIKPDIAVIVTTIKALKYHGGVEKEDIQYENIKGIQNGLHNLFTHVENLKVRYGLKVIVALNKFNTDKDEEIEFLEKALKEKNIELSIVEGWKKGGNGAIDIANKIIKETENAEEFINEFSMIRNEVNYLYPLRDDIKTKIEKIATKIYRATEVEFSIEAIEKIEKIEKMGYAKLPVCIAKTQYSLSDDSKNLQDKGKYKITIRDIELKAGAGFVVALAGKIMTMPGLPKKPSAENIDIDEDGNISGIF